MSGNRANAAAIQRRTAGAQSNVAPPGSSRPQQGQQQMRPQVQQQQMRPQPQQQSRGQPQQRQQQQQQQQQPQVQPKMSVSDAIGLITLRLGRLETFIRQMPPLDQIGSNTMGDIGENMRVVDEAVFTNIVARLEKLEQTPKESVSDDSKASNESVNTLRYSLSSLSAEFAQVKARLNTEQAPVNEQVNADLAQVKMTLNSELDHVKTVLNAEVDQVKTILMSLQSFTMQTDQRLSDYIFAEEQYRAQQYAEQQQPEEVDEPESESSEVAQSGDSEIVSETIDLKAFVESNV
jgi:hypothetical protein